MFNVTRIGKIELTRGDSCKFPIFINCGEDLHPRRYTLNDNDTLYFAVMEPNQPFEHAILRKVYTSKDEVTEAGDTVLSLSPKDTEYLLPGKYYYTVKMRTDLESGEYEVQTLISENEFILMR